MRSATPVAGPGQPASSIRPVIVDDLQRRLDGGQCEISARVRRGESEQLRLWFRFPEEFAPQQLDGSPFLAAVLVWAMRHREDIAVDAPVSPRLLAGLDGIFSMYSSFFPGEMRAVSVDAPRGEPSAASEVTGCFFTRGVDSWYAVLAALEDDPQEPPLTNLIFCPDFLPVDRWPDELVRAKTEETRRAAELTPCRFIEVFTNQKRDFRGHQLVAMALALGFTRMLIPSGGMRGELRPRATHPELDPRFSTERTRIVHYGDASRIQKVARIARSPQALATVHVCRYNQSADSENCCRCEKCLRTMIQLHALGADASAAFKDPLDPRVVAGMSKEIKHPHQWVDLLHALGDSAEDRRLAAAIRLVIMRADLRNAYERLREMGSDPELAGVREDLPRTLQDTHEAVRHMHRALHPDAHRRGRWEWLRLAPRMLRAVRSR